MKLKINKRALFTSIILLMLLFSNIIERVVPTAKYLDEAIAIYFGVTMLTHKVNKIHLAIFGLVACILIIGFCGNVFSGYDINILYCLFDAFNVFKFVFAAIGALFYFEKYKYGEDVLEYIITFIRIFIVIATLFMVLNWFVDVGMYTDYRFGIRSYNFLFTRVGSYYSACCIFLILFTIHIYATKDKHDIAYIVLVIINMCSTLRSRAFAFAILYLFLVYILLLRKKKEFRIWYIIPITVLLYSIGADQLYFYFSGDKARNILLQYSIITAQNYFPFGSGFASYGTAIAQKYYSPLYSVYHFFNYWGLSSDYGAYLTDDYWPALIGEFGYVGTILMASILVLIFMMFLKCVKNQYAKLCVIFLFGMLLISSIASSSFFTCTTMVVFLAAICNIKERTLNDYNSIENIMDNAD